MHYRVQIQRTRVDFSEVYVEADSQKESEEKADKFPKDGLEWEGLEETIELLYTELFPCTE